MSRQRFLALLAAAVLAIAGALYLSTQRNLQREPHGTALLPSLAGEMNTVTGLNVRRGSAAAVTLHEQSGHWTVAERGDYPADVPKLRKLLLALSDAKIIEEKTSNPANFPAIGVEDPSLPGATGAQISITARDGKHAVIIGKPVGAGNFVRREGENTSYSVEPGISFETDPRFWIDSRLLDLAAANIRSIEIRPAAGPAYTVHRAGAAGGTAAAGGNEVAGVAAASGGTAAIGGTAASGGTAAIGGTAAVGGTAAIGGTAAFTLDGVPPGRKAADSALLAPSPTTYSGLTAEDVTPAGNVDFGKAMVATVTLSDGNVITLTGASSGDKHWVQVRSTKDTALNEITAGRAFEIAGHRFDAIFRPLEQLLVPKAPPPDSNKGLSTKQPVPAPKS
jgi:Domain of unknown function (DUF4340)